MGTFKENIELIEEASADFINNSGAAEIDFEDESTKDMLEDMTEDEFDEIAEAMDLLSRFYNCQL